MPFAFGASFDALVSDEDNIMQKAQFVVKLSSLLSFPRN